MKKIIFSVLFISSLSSAEETISSLQSELLQQKISCERVIDRVFERIQKNNFDLSRKAPLNAFVTLNPYMHRRAKELDDYFLKHHTFIGPLHCVPVVLKDNIDTYDMPASSGSLSLLGNQPVHDAELVKRLRAAGAIFIGKTSMDEFASGFTGVSSRSGRTGNAYNPLLNAGGSSSGSAVAVSANFAVLGIGTDNSGSIRVPAAFNGIYGLRPTWGLVSQAGIFPRGNIDGVAGPMARTVTDLAKGLSAMNSQDYTRDLSPQALQGKRIGIIRHVNNLNPFAEIPPRILKIFDKSFANFRKAGATVIDIDIPNFSVDRDNNMAGEIEAIDRYLQGFPAARRSFKDICFSDRTRTFGPLAQCLKHMNETAKGNSRVYRDTIKLIDDNRHRIEALMQLHHLDALLMPIAKSGVPTDDGTQILTSPIPISSNSGLPGMSIIAGFTDGSDPLPVGIELIGKSFAEKHLLAMAYAYEQQLPPRVNPRVGLSASLLLDIPTMNNLISLCGERSYEWFLQHEKPLTAERFSRILKNELEKCTIPGLHKRV